MNPLQRLMIISNVHDNLNIVNTFNNDRIVNNILITVENILNLDNFERIDVRALDILYNLYSIFKVFAKFNLLKEYHKKKFYLINKKFIYKLMFMLSNPKSSNSNKIISTGNI